jgi:hypothetical protein
VRERYEEGTCSGWYVTSVTDREKHETTLTNWTTIALFTYSGQQPHRVCADYSNPFCLQSGPADSDTVRDLTQAEDRTVAIQGNVSWTPSGKSETATLVLFAKHTTHSEWQQIAQVHDASTPIPFDFKTRDQTAYQLALTITYDTSRVSETNDRPYTVEGIVRDTVA